MPQQMPGQQIQQPAMQQMQPTGPQQPGPIQPQQTGTLPEPEKKKGGLLKWLLIILGLAIVVALLFYLKIIP